MPYFSEAIYRSPSIITWLPLFHQPNEAQKQEMALFHSSAPGQNGRHFADDIFKCIFVNEQFCVLIKISLKFVPKGPIDNNTARGLENGLAPNRRQAIIWTNADPIHWRTRRH